MKPQKQAAVPARFRTHAVPLLALVALSGAACSDSDDNADASGNTGGSTAGGSATTGGSSSNVGRGFDELLADCPASSTLIQTTDWLSCLAGKSLIGADPFSKKPCELRIGADGALDYYRDGAVAIAVPERSTWQGPSGTYQNDGSGSRLIFLASVAPDLPAVEAEPRVTDVSISLFGLESQESTVEVKYLDAGLARQTYNCTLPLP